MISNVDDIESLYAEYGIEKEILGKISIWRGDITKLKVDVIVNAANERLLGGGGIDGAIHRAAGWDELQKECRKHGSCQVGSTVATSACNLRHVKRIFHTVGPQPRGGQPTRHDEADLVSCYRSSLNLAVENNYRTIAFPCISTGIYGYPNQAAAHRVINFLYNFFTEQKNRNLIDRVVLVLFVDIDIRCYNQAIKGLVDCIRRSNHRTVQRYEDSSSTSQTNDQAIETMIHRNQDPDCGLVQQDNFDPGMLRQRSWSPSQTNPPFDLHTNNSRRKSSSWCCLG